MARYLITGGAGFLGINLARYLLKKGHDVVSLDIAPFDYVDARDTVNAITGDIRNRADVDQAMVGVDVVVHTAAALPLYKKRDIYTTDVIGTRTVLASAEAHGVDRVVHISSTAVYGIPDHHPLREDDRLDGVGHYGRAKIRAERVCIDYRARGMCVPILRPKSFVGPERLGVFALLYDWAQAGKGFPMIGDGTNRYQLLDVEDLCEAIYLAATGDRTAVNNTFNIGAEEFTTMAEDYQAVLDEAGQGGRIRGLPAGPVIAVLRILSILHLSPLYKWVYETASKDSFVSIERARTVLGYRPRYSNKQALIRNYRWYLANQQSFLESAGVSHRVPWKQGVLRFARMLF